MNLADSISLDPHKWLYQPLDCGCLLYRDPQAGQRTFSHSGDYARTLSADPIEGFAFFEESLELSRRFRALKLWLSLRYHGVGAFRDSIKKDLRQARRLAEAIQKEPQLEVVAAGELSAVCFRYRGATSLSKEELNRLNLEVLTRVINRGRVYTLECFDRWKVLPACLHREPPHNRCGRQLRRPRGFGGGKRNQQLNRSADPSIQFRLTVCFSGRSCDEPPTMNPYSPGISCQPCWFVL